MRVKSLLNSELDKAEKRTTPEIGEHSHFMEEDGGWKPDLVECRKKNRLIVSNTDEHEDCSRVFQDLAPFGRYSSSSRRISSGLGGVAKREVIEPRRG
jgi:hypothetical protein